MQRLGSFLVIFGVASFILNMMDRQFTLLAWVDNWGSGVGIGIRVAMVVVGAGLWLAGGKRE